MFQPSFNTKSKLIYSITQVACEDILLFQKSTYEIFFLVESIQYKLSFQHIIKFIQETKLWKIIDKQL